ncbi:hypothetical protein ACJZ2D_006466 [Fusarium nematophilum]
MFIRHIIQDIQDNNREFLAPLHWLLLLPVNPSRRQLGLSETQNKANRVQKKLPVAATAKTGDEKLPDRYKLSQHPFYRKFRGSLLAMEPSFGYYLSAIKNYGGEAKLPGPIKKMLDNLVKEPETFQGALLSDREAMITTRLGEVSPSTGQHPTKHAGYVQVVRLDSRTNPCQPLPVADRTPSERVYNDEYQYNACSKPDTNAHSTQRQ